MTDSAPPPPPPPDPSGQNPYGQPQYAAPGGPQPGPLLDRFVARLIDNILLFVVNLIVVSIVVVGIVLGGNGNGISEDGLSFGAALVSAVLSTLIYLGYYVLMESTQGRTVGKMVMKLHTVGPAGGKPTTAEAFKRNIFMGYSILGVIPVIGGFIGFVGALVAMILIAVQINNDPAKRQGWHDKFAGGTEVVKQG